MTQCRLEKVRELMGQGIVNLTVLADRVGYSDPYYLSKCFKKYYGVSPTEYLRETADRGIIKK